jgi:heme-degrading monooxygenase HmoA
MEKPYTYTTRRVRAGSEDEFVRRWSEWVDWSHREGLEAPALLLRELEDPQAFISLGPWANMAAVRVGVPSPVLWTARDRPGAKQRSELRVPRATGVAEIGYVGLTELGVAA